MNCKLDYKLHSKGFYCQIFGAVALLKFLQTLALDFPYICLQFYPANSSRQEDKFFRDKCIAEILKGALALVAACNALQFFSFNRIVRSKALLYNSYVLFFFPEQPFYGNYSTLDSNRNTVISHAFASTRQDGVEKVEKGL